MTPDTERLLRLSDQRDAIERRLLAAERAAYEAGRAAGYEDALQDINEAWRRTPPLALRDGLTHEELERRRRHVCCRACRLAGCQPGCQRCEDRELGTFAARHEDDFGGRRAA